MKTIISRAKIVTPRYFDILDIDNKVLESIKKVLNTNKNINDDEFYIKVIEYQLKNNLVPDGIIGPKTYSSIVENFPELKLEHRYTDNRNIIEKRKNDEVFDKRRFKRRIGYIESRGRYDAVNKNTKALGKYQFIWRYWGDKIQAFLGRKITPEEFLNSPQIQEAWMDYYIDNYLLPEVDRLISQFPDAKYKGKEFIGAMLHFHGYSKVREYLRKGEDPTSKTKINPITMTEYAEKALSIS